MIPLSNRLIYEPVEIEDLEDILKINSDPLVVQYIRNGIIMNREEEFVALDRRIRYMQSNPGFGFWKIVQKKTNETIGFANLNHIEDDGPNNGKVHLGYKLARKFWRKGFGTEIATAILEHAKNNQKLGIVYAFVDPKNNNSKKILKRLEFLKELNITQVYNCDSLMFFKELK